MYLKNPSGISYRIKKFLHALGIQTIRKRENGHGQSIKDFHSCRHTFATICAERGIPLTTVQNALGHSSSEITKIYTAHLQKAHMKEAFKKFSLLKQKKTRHGLPNIFRLYVCLNKLNELPRKVVQKIAFMISENLSKEELESIFNVYGSTYTPNSENFRLPSKDFPREEYENFVSQEPYE